MNKKTDLRMGALVNLENARMWQQKALSVANSAFKPSSSSSLSSLSAGEGEGEGGEVREVSIYLLSVLSPAVGKFGLGKKRSLSQLEEFANVDFKEGKSLGREFLDSITLSLYLSNSLTIFQQYLSLRLTNKPTSRLPEPLRAVGFGREVAGRGGEEEEEGRAKETGEVTICTVMHTCTSISHTPTYLSHITHVTLSININVNVTYVCTQT